jgi:diguanylate cyclase (GGDEF)-like protein
MTAFTPPPRTQDEPPGRVTLVRLPATTKPSPSASHRQPGDATYHFPVITVPRLDLEVFPDSPYAAELQQGRPKLRFQPPLEADYLQSMLLHSRTLVRVTCVFAAVLTILRGAEQFLAGGWSRIFVVDIMAVALISLILAWMAWSFRFERSYPLWAPVLLPLRNAIVAAQISWAAAHGHVEMLMVLPIMVIGPLFFLGLRFRAAIACVAVTSVAYVTAATCFELPQLIALRSFAFLLVGVLACIIAALHLERSARRSFLEGRLIAELAQRDALTGTKNRRALDEHLTRLWQRAIEREVPLAVLLIDIDHFKAYNDLYGHQAGDQTLRRVAQAVQRFVRGPLDILARYGGEEFAVILYDVESNRACDIADLIRGAVGEMAIKHGGAPIAGLVTISIGVAAIEPTPDRTPRGALQLADQALYEAKVGGRNRVEMMDHTAHSQMETGVFAVSSANSAAFPVNLTSSRKKIRR